MRLRDDEMAERLRDVAERIYGPDGAEIVCTHISVVADGLTEIVAQFVIAPKVKP